MFVFNVVFNVCINVFHVPGARRASRPAARPGPPARPGRGWGAAGLEDRRSSGKSQQPHSCLLGDTAHEADKGSSKPVLEWLGLRISCAWVENIVLMEKYHVRKEDLGDGQHDL